MKEAHQNTSEKRGTASTHNIQEWKRVLIDNAILLLLLCGTFFGGYIAHRAPETKEITIQQPDKNFTSHLLQKTNTYATSNEDQNTANSDEGQGTVLGSTENNNAISSTETTTLSEKNANQKYVASVNGTKYYPINCSAANKINEENKVYFSTEEEAQAKGLSRTVVKTCDNLWE